MAVEEAILQLQKMPPNAVLYTYDYRLKEHFEVCEFIISPKLDKVFIDYRVIMKYKVRPHSKYLERFSSREDIESQYECTLPKDAHILLAWYIYEDYSGSSFVLYLQDGKLYEVNGSHCSCNGLEEQWEPEETTLAALKMRSFCGDNSEEADEALKSIIKKLEKGQIPEDNLPEKGPA